MEKKNNLIVIKLTAPDFARKLETSIQFGTPVSTLSIWGKVQKVNESLQFIVTLLPVPD